MYSICERLHQHYIIVAQVYTIDFVLGSVHEILLSVVTLTSKFNCSLRESSTFAFSS